MSDESTTEPTEPTEVGQPAEGLVAPVQERETDQETEDRHEKELAEERESREAILNPTGSEGPVTIPLDTESGPDDRRPEADEVILDKTDDDNE